MKIKIILANATIILISVFVFLNGYNMVTNIPVYADSTTDSWQQVTTNEQLVEAFRYYCKSRDLTIEGSVADAVTSFTTKTFNGICNTLGIDVTALQAEIKYETDNNLGNRFLFSSLGIDAYNRIFAQFLQDNDLSVGDSDVNKTVEEGYWFSDDNGNGCYVYVVNNFSNMSIIKTGSYYRFSPSYLSSLPVGNSTNYSLNYHNVNVSNYSIYASQSTSWISTMINYDGGNTFALARRGSSTYTGELRIAFDGNQLAFCGYQKDVYGSYSNFIVFKRFPSNSPAPTNTNISIVANIINNNTYEGDTIINNNGTPSDPNAPDPDDGGTITPPGTIGGGGTDGTINFPDLNLNLPEINWSLGDLSNKFPFCIPFDMIAFLTLLNGEPQAPHITGSIPLTSHYTWNLDLDFSEFDTFAGIMRGLEFVGFMFFLISATINIVRG